MISSLPPSVILILGGLIVPLLSGKVRQAFMLLLPCWCFYILWTLPLGDYGVIQFMDYQLVLLHLDRLSRVFGYIFSIITLIGVIYSLHVKDTMQHVAALIYGGSAIGVTFAGDWFSLYVYWEFMAVASTFLILANRTDAARQAAYRYLLVHLFGGLLLLAGIILQIQATGSIKVDFVGLDNVASWLIFLGVALNAAVPPLHPWLKDAYPEATVTGAVFMSALTTKSAVYVMARTFPGTELLIYIGAFMTIFPIFFAVLENDIRRVLSYSLMNQVGYMLCGVGIGTALAMNGTVAHAFCHILYKGVLFMAAGSVLHMTGKIKCTDLGGLYKTMPFTCLCCLIGSASISGFPLFSGFISKSMIVSASGIEGLTLVWFLLMFASVGVIDHAGIKVPYFTFFSHDSGLRASDPPWNMRIAMGIAAFLCVAVGVYPEPLYNILPYPVDYVPYTGAHVIEMLQLLLFGAAAFVLLIYAGYYPAEIRAINLDFDWFYRKGGKAFYWVMDKLLNGINAASDKTLVKGLSSKLAKLCRDLPARAVVAVLTPIWTISGRGGDQLEERKKNVYDALATGSTPVGVGAVASAVILAALWAFAR